MWTLLIFGECRFVGDLQGVLWAHGDCWRLIDLLAVGFYQENRDGLCEPINQRPQWGTPYVISEKWAQSSLDPCQHPLPSTSLACSGCVHKHQEERERKHNERHSSMPLTLSDSGGQKWWLGSQLSLCCRAQNWVCSIHSGRSMVKPVAIWRPRLEAHILSLINISKACSFFSLAGDWHGTSCRQIVCFGLFKLVMVFLLVGENGKKVDLLVLSSVFSGFYFRHADYVTVSTVAPGIFIFNYFSRYAPPVSAHIMTAHTYMHRYAPPLPTHDCTCIHDT